MELEFDESGIVSIRNVSKKYVFKIQVIFLALIVFYVLLIIFYSAMAFMDPENMGGNISSVVVMLVILSAPAYGMYITRKFKVDAMLND